MLRSARQLASSLLAQAEACSSGSSSLEAVRGICSTPWAQRRLFPPAEPVRPADGE